ncbi:MAG: hypothetical protein K2X87_02905 [Gemmataceae bacterium]|nr:hypothetical protein [Gemmataceae bacterium]
MVTIGHRAGHIPQDRFVAAWNGGATLDEAVKRLADGPVPRWAARARAADLRHAGVEVKDFAAEEAA